MADLEIILVEDDEALAIGIEYSLKKEGYDVRRIADFKEGLEFIASNQPAVKRRLGLFDVMLPDGSGFDLFKQLRASGDNMPVIFLTAMSEEVNVLKGLDLGADDYIAKPFRVKELIARIKAVSRRCYGLDTENSNSKIRYRKLVVDTQAMKTFVIDKTSNQQKMIELTANEYKLLLLFLNNQGVVLERKVILERLFDSNGNFVDDNTLSVYIRRLREKIDDNDKTVPYIKTVHGVGYIMEKEDA